MEGIYDLLIQIKDFINPKHLIDYMLNLLGVYVYFGLFFIVFAETGLAVGFFLPGDSLLVVSGLMAKTVPDKLNVLLVMLSFFLGSVVGDNTGYWTGRYMGKRLFNRESSRIFKPSRVQKAHDFFEKYGVKTVVLARFVPIIRTFAPLVVGAAEMPYYKLIEFLKHRHGKKSADLEPEAN
jgi:membrane-associated protein